jgi:hypothetical protein
MKETGRCGQGISQINRSQNKSRSYLYLKPPVVSKCKHEKQVAKLPAIFRCNRVAYGKWTEFEYIKRLELVKNSTVVDDYKRTQTRQKS